MKQTYLFISKLTRNIITKDKLRSIICPKARSPLNVLIFIILVNSILLFLQPVSGMATGTLNTSHEKVFSYSVKIINTRKKSEYVIKKLRINNVFKSIDDLKDTLSTVNVASTIDQVGFIEPGHGAKGRQQWLTDSEDLKDMYSLHQYRNEIIFWCYSVKEASCSRSVSESCSKSFGEKRKQ